MNLIMPQKSFIVSFPHIYLKGIGLIGSITVYAQKGHHYYLNRINSWNKYGKQRLPYYPQMDKASNWEIPVHVAFKLN